MSLLNFTFETEEKQFLGTYDFNNVDKYVQMIGWRAIEHSKTVKQHYLRLKSSILVKYLSAGAAEVQDETFTTLVRNNPDFTFYHIASSLDIGRYWAYEVLKRPSLTFLSSRGVLDDGSVVIDELEDALQNQPIGKDKLVEIFQWPSQLPNRINIRINNTAPHTIIMTSLVKKIVEAQYNISL